MLRPASGRSWGVGKNDGILPILCPNSGLWTLGMQQDSNMTGNTTRYHPMIAGRSTWFSLGKRVAGGKSVLRTCELHATLGHR